MSYRGVPDRAAQKIAEAEQLARHNQKRSEEMHRLNRPVWTKVNRLELLIASAIIGLIVAWVLYLALT